jgi:hypothetical protein
MMDYLSDWITPEMLVDLAMYDLGMGVSIEGLNDDDIKKIIRYLGIWATNVETPALENPRISLFGLSMMLSVCLQVFPKFYEKNELSQFN